MKTFLAFAALAALFAVTTASAQTPADAGIQYEEISRTIMMGATPPPPGGFEADFAQVHDGKIVSVNPLVAAIPKMPAMPKMGFSSFLGMIFNPAAALMNIAMQAALGSITSNAMNGMVSKYRNYESGQLQRFAYYGGFSRFENVATKHLTIADPTKQQQYEMDLESQSYKITPITADWRSQLPKPAGTQGTASIDLAIQTTQQPGLTIEGYDTDLYSTVEDVTVTNATGSCHNMRMRLEIAQYLSKTVSMTTGTSMTLDQMLGDNPQFAAGSNCVANVTSHKSGVDVPGNRLVLYSRMAMEMPDQEAQMRQAAQKMAAEGQTVPDFMKIGGPVMVMVTERGNIKSVAASDVSTLFAVPSGFKQQP